MAFKDAFYDNNYQKSGTDNWKRFDLTVKIFIMSKGA